MFPLHPLIELNYVLNVVLVFMFVFNLHLLLTILSLSQVRFLLFDFMIIILMNMFSRHLGEKIQFQKNGEKLHGLNHNFLILTPPPPPPPPPPKQSELEVRKIIHLQNLANQLPDGFIDSTKVTKSHIPAPNILARIEIPMGKLKYGMVN